MYLTGFADEASQDVDIPIKATKCAHCASSLT